MKNNALVATNGTYITPNGVITGTGTLAVNFLGLQNDGTLAPGINVLYPLAPLPHLHPTLQAHGVRRRRWRFQRHTDHRPHRSAGDSLDRQRAQGQYGSLAVTGTASLDGVLALNFSNGYAPSQGDTFTFLTATDGISGTFDSVEISGLAPGFEYELTIVNGQVMLEALNDGVPLQTVFLPLVRR